MLPDGSVIVVRISIIYYPSIISRDLYLYTTIILIFSTFRCCDYGSSSRYRTNNLTIQAECWSLAVFTWITFWTNSTSFLLLALIQATSMLFFITRSSTFSRTYPSLEISAFESLNWFFISSNSLDIWSLWSYARCFSSLDTSAWASARTLVIEELMMSLRSLSNNWI